ncbi:hypothetical protein [Aureliella helgolandensis]|uniref:Phage-like element PBSX protein XkdM n=1 Tax=Aureliella helgolandensis TaxID=2527968 RepID=A0A518GEA8_9BACT|nr:hypothetical protein [Aureliella helgolandensis]QDV26935.1 hypothetical protein Q31a_53150 [Aureliella helgolandensis]
MTTGRTCKAYVNIGGTLATPTWVEMKRISNVARPKGRGTSDRMYRGAKNKKKVTGYREFGFSFTYVPARAGSAAATADTVITTLEDSLDNETILDVCFMDAAVTGDAVGVRGYVQVSKFDRKEDDEDSVTYDVELVEVEEYDGAGDLVEIDAYETTEP